MQWVELSATVDSSSVEKVVSVLAPFGHGGAAVEEWQAENSDQQHFVVRIYLPNQRSFQKIRRDIESKLLLLSGTARIHIHERLLKPADWLDSLKKHFGVTEIGERFIIRPSWILQTPPDNDRIVIELDPGAAFGTGLHATTRLCLVALEKYLRPGMFVLDLGTGSGILAIAAAKLGAARVMALDIDKVAVRSATDNARKNRADSQVAVKRGTLSLRFRRGNRGAFDLVLANITARAISDCSRGFAEVLKPGGRLAASGIHPGGLDEVLINLAMASFSIEAIIQSGDWYGVIAVRDPG